MVNAKLDRKYDPTAVKVSTEEMDFWSL